MKELLKRQILELDSERTENFLSQMNRKGSEYIAVPVENEEKLQIAIFLNGEEIEKICAHAIWMVLVSFGKEVTVEPVSMSVFLYSMFMQGGSVCLDWDQYQILRKADQDPVEAASLAESINQHCLGRE